MVRFIQNATTIGIIKDCIGIEFQWKIEKDIEKEEKNNMVEIQKNSREVIRIEESEYEGHKFVDCRIYYDDNGEYRPTKKGISFSHKIAQEVVEAIIETMEESNWKDFETN